MKITDVKIYPVSAGLNRVVSSGLKVGRVFVEVKTDEGITGWGECTNSPRKGNMLVAHAEETVKSTLVGRDPFHIEAIWQELYLSDRPGLGIEPNMDYIKANPDPEWK